MANETRTYQLVIIGGGPAGIVAAATAASAQRTVALVDNHQELGGAGINTGTVPSKTLRETALALSGLKARKLTGVDLSLSQEVTVADFLRHEQNVKAGFNAMISQQLRADKTDVYFGTGAFVDPHTIRVQPSKNRPARGQALRLALRRCCGARASSSRPVPRRFARPFSLSAVRRFMTRTRFCIWTFCRRNWPWWARG